MPIILTPHGPVDVIDGERLVEVVPAPLTVPPALPDPEAQVLRLAGARTEAEVGDRPPVASLTLDPSQDNVHFRRFEVVFGRDSLLISRMLRDRHPRLELTTLLHLAAYQGLPRDRAPEPHLYGAREEEAGRIPHEIRDPRTDPTAQRISAVEGWGWPFYRSDDATVLFIKGLAERALDDPSILDRTVTQRDGVPRTLGEALTASLRWAERRCGNPEGLLESMRPARKTAAIELAAYPTWQDSPDSAFRPDGTLCTGPMAWAELQAWYYDALEATSRLARAEPSRARALGLDARDLSARARRLRESTIQALWVDEREDPRGAYFAYAAERVNGRLQPVRVLKSNAGPLLDSGILDGPNMRRYVNTIVRTLLDPRYGLVCPSGVRSCSKRERRFRPTSYHDGSVWLWENHRFAEGLRRHGFDGLARSLDTNVRRVCAALRRYPEYVTGDDAAAPRTASLVVRAIAHDPVYGDWPNIDQPPQLVQGWTVAAYVDAGRVLALPDRRPVRPPLERALLPGLQALVAPRRGAGLEGVA